MGSGVGIGKVLAIGGSDPSGGGGIQADEKTLVELGVYPYTAIAAVTAQNSTGVRLAVVVEADILQAQVEAVLEDGPIDGLKTGMLGSWENMVIVAGLIESGAVRYSVIDPVLKAGSGASLAPARATELMKLRVLPHAFMVTPNIHEAVELSGIEIRDRDDMLAAAKVIKGTGVRWVLIKGGHLSGDTAVDLLYDGEAEHYLEDTRVRSENVRGTGCMMASAICAHLVRGLEPLDAVRRAKAYVHAKIAAARPLGKGSLQATHFCTRDTEGE